ncbi:Daunorubicin/doxorubicin resistance ATP-binding protein DrrA [Methyloligella halotolerans]|uniref:Daunorubicin/doxorubicin resistance ATP-binding protein DrrA n=1 Tax=Methyloligella halotolerans TaxID=1177755 RepID=A0A1E2RXR6_9HYPH|nr:Daunorubicin/doxorubicin resistance ATP-binding protein DrrA [Methyloligella halotolerans]
MDVELRQAMWEVVRKLRDRGVTIILTTHYILEAEEMADRIGVINHGEIIVVQDKVDLMRAFGRKQLRLQLQERIDSVPEQLSPFGLSLEEGGDVLVYDYDTQAERTGITSLLTALSEAGVRFSDLDTKQSSLEDIFVSLVKEPS